MSNETYLVTWDDIRDIDTCDVEYYCKDCKTTFEIKPREACWACKSRNVWQRGHYYIKAVVPFDKPQD